MHDYLIWDPDPVLFSLWGLQVRWYGFLFALSFLGGFCIFSWIFKREGRDADHLDPLATYILMGTVVGARLGHCLFYEPVFYLSHPLEILKIYNGGLASHGGALGILIGLFLFVKKYREYSMLWLLDRLSIVFSLGASLIRLGNLMNSEIVGKVSYVPWAFIFPLEGPEPRHPTQIYESLGYGLICVALLCLYRFIPTLLKYEGRLFGLFLILAFLFRTFVEIFKKSQVPFEDLLLLNMGQILSFPFVFIGFFLLHRAHIKK